MKAAVITVSDSSYQGTRQDKSGPAVAAALRTRGFEIVASEIVPDTHTKIVAAIKRLTRKAQLVVTTGGTGVAERDITPDATRAVCDRLVEGVTERMRAEGMKKTPLAALSRAVCGIRGRSLVLNLPGSPSAATESLSAVIDLLPHALELLQGNTEHAEGKFR